MTDEPYTGPKLVQLREAPPLNDIPGHLRAMADGIEAGEEGDYVGTESLIVVIPVSGDYPRIFAFGDVDGVNYPPTQFELAKLWMLTNMVARTP